MSKRAYGKFLFFLLIVGLITYDVWSFSNAFNFRYTGLIIFFLQLGWWIGIIVTFMFIFLLASLIKQDNSLF